MIQDGKTIFLFTKRKLCVEIEYIRYLTCFLLFKYITDRNHIVSHVI